MILSFGNKETKKFFNREASRIPASIHEQAYDKLLLIDAATNVDELRNPPGNRL